MKAGREEGALQNSVTGMQEYPWEMVFEALLRCGGNLVIPGTDKYCTILC